MRNVKVKILSLKIDFVHFSEDCAKSIQFKDFQYLHDINLLVAALHPKSL